MGIYCTLDCETGRSAGDKAFVVWLGTPPQRESPLCSHSLHYYILGGSHANTQREKERLEQKKGEDADVFTRVRKM